jgi:hypothetical protein
LDALLLFAGQQGQLSRFVPRLESKREQRDEAIEELRTAFLLDSIGFRIQQWDPPASNGKVGEYLISTPEKIVVFVELKSPGWEGQLSEEQRKTGRAKQPKYRHLEGGAVGNWIPVQKCIASENTYGKFAPTQSNLLIVADDLMISLHDSWNHVELALYNKNRGYGTTGYFNSAQFENLGGVGIFRAFLDGRGVKYEFQIFDNPFALRSTKLPDSILKFRSTFTGVVAASLRNFV